MVLYLLPLEEVDEADLVELERYITESLGFETRRMNSMDIPRESYDAGRDQYDATHILRSALLLCPADATRLLVITERDIFIPMLTFIFGQAQVDGTAAILSLTRLRQKFYGLPPRRDLFIHRLLKETLHELGHTFGLTHCTNPRCAMSLSINVAHIDRKRGELCRSCSVRLGDKLDALRRQYGENRSDS